MAFAVVTHLSPERESLLHEVIGRYTDMPVKVAEDDMPVEPDIVYVMPQNAVLTIDDTRLRIHTPNVQNRERKPIDVFFSTLAKDQGERSVGIILSGADSDGALGLKAIKEYGGLTMAQLPNGSGPHNPDMPQSAIASGVVDIAISAEEMGQKLVALAGGLDLHGSLDGSEWKEEGRKLIGAREAICAELRGQSRHDFSGYKTKTFFRRVRRRMQLAQITSIEAYVERLRTDPGEAQSLFRDLLINVTNFFREPTLSRRSARSWCLVCSKDHRLRHGANLDTRLRDGRGGLFSRDSFTRAHGHPHGDSARADIRDRH